MEPRTDGWPFFIKYTGIRTDAFLPSPDAHHLAIVLASGGKDPAKNRAVHSAYGTLLAPNEALARSEYFPDGDCFYLSFQLYRQGDACPLSAGAEGLPYNHTLLLPSAAQVTDILSRLQAYPSPMNWSDSFANQIEVQRLLLLLWNASEQQPAGDVELAVRHTIDYIHLHYDKSITAAQLQQLSGLRRWQYNSVFRQMTGKRLLDYVNEIRMEKAKYLLSHTDEPLREIAKSVGLKDEYYLNRRFSQFMGVSPKKYARLALRKRTMVRFSGPACPNPPQRIVTESQALGDLLCLGVMPYAAAIGSLRDEVAFAPLLETVQDIGTYATAERLADLRPDLIVCETVDETRLRQLGEVAFTLSIDRAVSADDRLRLVADRVGRQQQAETWIREHEQRVQTMWRRIRAQSHIQIQPTAACFVLIERDLYVMASQGLPTTVYHPDGFRPCAKIERMIRERIDFRRIQTDKLGEYAADRFLLLVSNDACSIGCANELMQAGTLHKHAAHVHLGEAKWNYDDAYTRGLLPDMLAELLQN